MILYQPEKNEKPENAKTPYFTRVLAVLKRSYLATKYDFFNTKYDF